MEEKAVEFIMGFYGVSRDIACKYYQDEIQAYMKLCGVGEFATALHGRAIVHCSECGEKHLTTEVEFLNIEEDMQGRDVMHYTCPITNQPTKSLVYTK